MANPTVTLRPGFERAEIERAGFTTEDSSEPDSDQYRIYYQFDDGRAQTTGSIILDEVDGGVTLTGLTEMSLAHIDQVNQSTYLVVQDGHLFFATSAMPGASSMRRGERII